MSDYSKYFGSFWVRVLYIIWIPLFFLSFMIVFRPEPFCSYLEVGSKRYSFYISIIMSIILGVVLVSRLAYYFFRHKIDTQNKFSVWCLIESIVICCFVAMFIGLAHKPRLLYFDTLYKTLGYMLPILLIDYVIITLGLIIHYLNHKRKETDVEDMRLKFYDSNHLLKLTISASSLLFVEADENYIKVCYEESGKLKEKALRSSMKSIEEMCEKAGILRCHRSYFVNMAHVKVLRKDKEGIIYIELDNSEAKQLTVSKRYYDLISSKL